MQDPASQDQIESIRVECERLREEVRQLQELLAQNKIPIPAPAANLPPAIEVRTRIVPDPAEVASAVPL